jgi:hypothetical protein
MLGKLSGGLRSPSCNDLVRMTHLLAPALAVLFINLPFGYWRAGTRKFSWAWFLAVHGPVPLVVAVRLLAHLGFQLATVPVLVAAFFSGQVLGGRVRTWWRAEGSSP